MRRWKRRRRRGGTLVRSEDGVWEERERGREGENEEDE